MSAAESAGQATQKSKNVNRVRHVQQETAGPLRGVSFLGCGFTFAVCYAGKELLSYTVAGCSC